MSRNEIKMTKKLIVLGDSLVDAGNTAEVMALFGQYPFEDPIYDKGGNIKASDGPVLSEFIALEMGARNDQAQLISVLSIEQPNQLQAHNYAHAGARTDYSPGYPLPITGETIGIGLKEQKKALAQRKPFYQEMPDVDVLISCGGNDIRDAFDLVPTIQDVISTKNKKDDKKFAASIAKPIARNLNKIVNFLVPFTDEIAVLGSPPIMETPEAQDWLTNFAAEDQSKASNVIDLIGKKLIHKLENKTENLDNVAIMNGTLLWNQLDAPSFVDTIHPDAATSSELAKLFVREADNTFTSFSF